MSGRYTFAMIKPDALQAGNAGKILAAIEEAGFNIRAMRLVRLSRVEAEAFYEVHRGRPFDVKPLGFVSSAPSVALALEAADAVTAWRGTIGATDPAEAAPGTVRKLYAESKERNAIHASDSDENALREIGFFFAERERIETR